MGTVVFRNVGQSSSSWHSFGTRGKQKCKSFPVILHCSFLEQHVVLDVLIQNSFVKTLLSNLICSITKNVHTQSNVYLVPDNPSHIICPRNRQSHIVPHPASRTSEGDPRSLLRLDSAMADGRPGSTRTATTVAAEGSRYSNAQNTADTAGTCPSR